MDSSTKVSFVMPAFNAAETIAEAVNSIMNGNFTVGDELIIINDSSGDETDKVVKELKNIYPEILYLVNPVNLGCPATRNIGIRAASNPLIFNMDADDLLVKNSVAKLKKAMLKKKVDLVAFGESRFFKHQNPKFITHSCIYKPGIMTLADYLTGPIVPGGNYLYTKASWEKIGGYWEYGKGLHEFWGFTLKQLANGAKVYVLPRSYYLHRYNKDSLFSREGKSSEDMSLMATKMLMNFIDLLNDDDAKYLRSDFGSRHWYGEYSQRPLRLKNGQIGIKGRDRLNRTTAIFNFLAKRFPLSLNFLKKIKISFVPKNRNK
jgi:glycosyltransferase involved in cell wall biosynthesis